MSGRLRSPGSCYVSSFHRRAAVRPIPASLCARFAAGPSGPCNGGMEFVPAGIFIPGTGVLTVSHRETSETVPGNGWADEVLAIHGLGLLKARQKCAVFPQCWGRTKTGSSASIRGLVGRGCAPTDAHQEVPR